LAASFSSSGIIHPVNQPSPAIVAQGSVRRLPHLALWLFALAYVLPGFIGRMPWRSEDITAFGYMVELAYGRTDWFAPTLFGAPPEVDGLLPYWLGAWAMQLAPAWLPVDFAARLPFIGLLALTLVAVWQGIYYLARSPLAQPVAFAFGGEARPNDYARALADGGLLAFIACLGLAQLSHETTPALAQLCFVALSFYAFAALPFRRWTPALSALAGLTGLTLSGGPSMAVLLAAGGLLAHVMDRTQAREEPRRHRRGMWRLIALTLLIAVLASVLNLWRWRIQLPAAQWSAWEGLARLLLWFTWPVWPLVLWTLWRWRRQLFDRRPSRHLSLPLWFALITVGATLITPAGDRALLLALPALATLAAFALPTLGRSVAALIDWFTLLFFTTCALVIWVVWIAMQTGFPPQPAANVARLLPGFEPRFVILPLLFATAATLAWGWLVKWRIGRHRAALWKSLVLPAGGAALCWLLLTTLWMPALDFARSYVPLVRRIEATVQPQACIAYFGLSRGQLAAIQFHGHLQPEPLSDSARCDWLLIDHAIVSQTPEIVNAVQWERHSELGHPRAGEEDLVFFRRRIDAPR
jgi:4-amino-4-deoxy-L-arabinose transferase-like glycosyltransferase